MNSEGAPRFCGISTKADGTQCENHRRRFITRAFHARVVWLVAVSGTAQLARKELASISGLCITVISLIIRARTQRNLGGRWLPLAGEFVIVMVTAPRQRLMYTDDDHASWHRTT